MATCGLVNCTVGRGYCIDATEAFSAYCRCKIPWNGSSCDNSCLESVQIVYFILAGLHGAVAALTIRKMKIVCSASLPGKPIKLALLGCTGLAGLMRSVLQFADPNEASGGSWVWEFVYLLSLNFWLAAYGTMILSWLSTLEAAKCNAVFDVKALFSRGK